MKHVKKYVCNEIWNSNSFPNFIKWWDWFTELGLLALQINAVTWWILAVGIWKILIQKQSEKQWISLPYAWIHLVSVIRQQNFPNQSPRLNFLNIYLSAQLSYSMIFFSVPQAYPFSSPCEHYSAGCWSDCWFTVWFRWSCLSFDCWTLWQGRNLP